MRKVWLWFGLAVTGLQGQTVPDDVIERISRHMEKYADFGSFTVSAVNTIADMDARWRPKETTIIEKRISQNGTDRRVDIVRAVRRKDGIEEDITRSQREEEEKRRERFRNGEERRDGGREMSMDMEEMLPFSSRKRLMYRFTVLPDTLIEGRKGVRIQSTVLVPVDSLMQGIYVLDAETDDLMHVELQPSKMPKMVKEMLFKMDLTVLPGNHLMLSRFWMRFYLNAIVKKVRMVIDEVYTEYTVHSGLNDME